MTDWNEHEDAISDVISDSIDMDWTSRTGAKAVVAWLNENAAAPAPSSLAGGEVREAVHAWLREDASLASKMNMTPDVVERLVCRLAALSPEAPAREAWEKLPEMDRGFYDYLREIEVLDGYDQIVDWPEIVAALRQRDVNRDAEIEALTPRHEATASEGGA